MAQTHRRRRFAGRDPEEAHRASTPLELLYDLTIVVAIGQAADELAHYLAEGHTTAALVGFVFSAFAVTWAWLQYSWFASAYDTDDWVFRLATLIQMAGVVVLALGVEQLFASIDHGDTLDIGVVVTGYVVMRVALVGLWLIAARQDPERAPTARTYAGWLGVTQSGWVALVFVDFSVTASLLCAAVLISIEMTGPYLAEKRSGTSWHPHHIAERYSLLAIITLGEGIIGTVASLNADVHAEHGWTTGAVLVLVAGLGVTFGLWWMYFVVPWGELLERHRERGFFFGYLHLVFFAALAAVGAGLHVAAYALDGETELGHVATVLCTAAPVGIAVVAFFVISWLVMGAFDAFHIGLVLGAGVVIGIALLAAAAGASVPAALVVLVLVPAVIVVGYETIGHRHMTAAMERDSRGSVPVEPGV